MYVCNIYIKNVMKMDFTTNICCQKPKLYIEICVVKKSRQYTQRSATHNIKCFSEERLKQFHQLRRYTSLLFGAS